MQSADLIVLTTFIALLALVGWPLGFSLAQPPLGLGCIGAFQTVGGPLFDVSVRTGVRQCVDFDAVVRTKTSARGAMRLTTFLASRNFAIKSRCRVSPAPLLVGVLSPRRTLTDGA